MTRTALWERLDDALNPVLLKELRQAVRGRFVVSALVLSLIAESITAVTMYISGQLGDFRVDSRPVGPQTFTMLFGVIFFTSMLVVPLYCGLRMAAERGDANTDLMYITTIAPRSIVLGKLLAVGAFVGLLFGSAAPFLAFSFVLRGLDVVQCLVAVSLAFLAILAEATLALFIGALPVTRSFKAVLGLLIVSSSLLVSVIGISLTSTIREGVVARGGVGAPPGVLTILLSFAATIVIAAIVLTVLTTGLLTPPAANRALPIRVMLTVLWGVTLYIAVGSANSTRTMTPVVWWAWTQLAVSGLVLLSAVGEREWWGKRILRTIPRSFLSRATAFVFYSGGAGGVVWTTLMMIATIVATAVTGRWAAPVALTSGAVDVVMLSFDLVSASLAILAYGLTAVAVHRRLFAHLMLQKHTWTIAVLLLFLFAVIVPLAATLHYMDTPRSEQAFAWAIAANPFVPLSSEWVALTRLLGLGLWLTVVVAWNLRWGITQWARFRPEEDAPAPAIPAVSALEDLVSE
jgi:hypothetical protein